MYPRNAASPPRVVVGPVVQIADGAVQSAGVSVVVRQEGGSETAGGGTISYGATSSAVYYTPTQAETDATAFAVVAYKTGCIPASVQVITSAESVSGRVTVGSIATDAIDAAALATDAITEIQAGLSTLTSANVSTAVWDVALATYSTVAGSFGKSFKNLSDGIISTDGAVNDAAATASSFVTNLSYSQDDFVNDKILVFTAGSLEGQGRIIADYNGTTKAVSFDEPFTAAPADGDDFVLLAIHQHTLTQIYDAVMTTQMTESYATQGTAPTPAQVMMWVYQRSADAAVSGTTLTVRQLDQTTAAGTVTLDDADNPTTLTRAT